MLDIPGDPLPPGDEAELRRVVARLCGLEHTRFPGSQPVSFKVKDLDVLAEEDYWVCEKSDGIRVLMLILPFEDSQSVYLIDRKNIYRSVHGVYFPHYADKTRPLGPSLIDGELVLDTVDPSTGTKMMRYLAFDCLICDNENVMSKPLPSRFGRLGQRIVTPYQKMMREFPDMAQSLPFQTKVKPMELAYHVGKVWNEDMKRLQHESDGLIYTCVDAGYVVGTDPKQLKWKAPSENSIDFKLELRFPPLAGSRNEPDFTEMPSFHLLAFYGENKVNRGESRYEYFDIMDVSAEEWESMKATGEQFDDRIIECTWDSEKKNWKFMRFRNDKTDGNHITVVQNIIESIKDGVEVDELLESATRVKAEWKAREENGKVVHTSNHHPDQRNGTRAPPSKELSDAIEARRKAGYFSRVSGPLFVLGFRR